MDLTTFLRRTPWLFVVSPSTKTWVGQWVEPLIKTWNWESIPGCISCMDIWICKDIYIYAIYIYRYVVHTCLLISIMNIGGICKDIHTWTQKRADTRLNSGWHDLPSPGQWINFTIHHLIPVHYIDWYCRHKKQGWNMMESWQHIFLDEGCWGNPTGCPWPSPPHWEAPAPRNQAFLSPQAVFYRSKCEMYEIHGILKVKQATKKILN